MAPSTVTPTPDELARHVLTRRLALRRGEKVLIESFPRALPWANAFVRQARRLDARPFLHYEDERSYWDTIDSGHVDAIGEPGEHEWAALDATDVYVYFWGPEDLRRRDRLSDGVRSRSVAYNQRWYERARAVGLRGARMEIGKVTEPNARYYGLNYRAWRAEILAATMRDPDALRPAFRRLERSLGRGREVRLTAPGGTDLTLALDHGPVRVFDGTRTGPAPKRWRFASMATVPSAAVGTRLNGGIAEGTLVANRPSYLGSGIAQGGTARFEDGRVTRLSFRHGGAEVRKEFNAASKGGDQPGFIEIGVEPALHISPDLEDCEAGAVTIGIGANGGWGGKNRSDFMTWLVVAGGKLTVDGREIVRRGRVL